MARPGTTDYSRWELLAADISSDEEEKEEKCEEEEWKAGTARVQAEEQHPPLQATAPQVRRRLRTGTCIHCARQNVEKRCSRCQVHFLFP